MLSLANRSRGRIPVDARGELPVRVGPYHLCVELASGGMATVYLAHDGRAGAAARFAAVKLIHPHLANDPVFAEMFADEAEIASRIRHPNVCSVLDYEVSRGRSYIAMEYLVGESMGSVWRKISRGSRKNTARLVPLVAKALADACEGLHAAHELTDADGDPLEVVHRDVSPGNIVMTFDGVTKVVDFGVAAAASKRHRTETGMLKGKLAYIAPECLRGQRADRRSDVWGVGVVAWELVTGERLFRHDSDVDTLRAVTEAPIRPPSEVCPDLPKELDDVLMLALQRNPDDRYETARDLGRDLARFAARDEIVTTTDLGEWLCKLFPGEKERNEQLLELTMQIARGKRNAPPEREPEKTRTKEPGTQEHEPTRVFQRAEPALESTPTRVRSRGASWPALATALGIGLATGVGAAAGAAWAFQADREPVAAPIVAAPAPIPVAAPVREREEARPELRISPGSGLARGPYVLELVDSAPDELLLRIALERPDPPVATDDAPATQTASSVSGNPNEI